MRGLMLMPININKFSDDCRKIDFFTDLYNIQKTLRFRLIPIGATADNFVFKDRLSKEKDLLDSAKRIKEYISKYLADESDKCLSQPIKLKHLDEYYELYITKDRDEQKFKSAEEKLRKELADFLKEILKRLNKKILNDYLPEYLDDDEKALEDIANLSSFSTYFNSYYDNCKNMYTDKEQSTAIPYRCINDNLPKFIDNMKAYEKALEELKPSDLEELRNNFKGVYDTTVDDMFTLDYFNCVLSQSGIDTYNAIIGNDKVKGINEYINLHNQTAQQGHKVPNLKRLYKQIGSQKKTISFLPSKFENDNELLKAVYDFYNTGNAEKNFTALKDTITELEKIFDNLAEYNLDGVFVRNDISLTNLSQNMFNDWSVFRNLWNDRYDKANNPEKAKDIDKYNDKRRNVYKKSESFSIIQLQDLIATSLEEDIGSKKITDYFSCDFHRVTTEVENKYQLVKDLLSTDYPENKSLKTSEKDVALIKDFLDSIKALESFVKILTGTDKESGKDELFYGNFTKWFDQLRYIDKLYDKVRNYITEKPYSLDKIKLSFDNPDFLSGWAKKKEVARSAQLFTKDGLYYLGVMDKNTKKEFSKKYNDPEDANDVMTKIEYEQIKSPSMVIQSLLVVNGETVKKNGRKNDDGVNVVLEELKNQYLPENINRIRKTESYKTTSDNFNRDELTEYLEYYIERVKEYYDQYRFIFKPADQYVSYVDFSDDVERQAYQITKVKVSEKQLLSLVEQGKLYLFQIYNKDFSEYSNGKKNLHTMYFQMLFDDRNLENLVYKLQGGAEMFYRPASIKKDSKFQHDANVEIIKRTCEDKVKDKDNPTDDEKAKYYSKFNYDIVKNKRFTEAQFSLHLTLAMNCNQPDHYWLNNSVRELLKKSNKNNIIGIDRGERNLIYVTIINSDGVIVDQINFNIIENSYNGKKYKTDYQKKLNIREKERQEARQNWKTIETIKELKDGYISQVVHQICKLIVYYDAIVVMENLNGSFKRGRTKVEKQVYQKFETMLINKLNYYVDKGADYKECGGLLKAYQLTNKFETFERIGKQSGIIFYVDPYLTSKIDPVTGFANLLYPKYETIPKTHNFISNIDDIRYNRSEDYFEFDVDYDKFPQGSYNYRKKWTICSYGNRIQYYKDSRNKPASRVVNITEKFKETFNNAGIDFVNDNIKEKLLLVNSKELLKSFMDTLKLTVQLRNSEINSDVDYIISPVKDRNGNFYYSENYKKSNEEVPTQPQDGDANGAYNIARKGLMIINKLKNTDDVTNNELLKISKKEWLEFAQKGDLGE